MTSLPPRSRTAAATARIALAPLEDTLTFADRAYAALKEVILSLDIYDRPGEVRLDERALASDLGISRTPVREAMAQLEREGFVRAVPRRGTERTNPSRSSCAMASRTGVRLMPRSLASRRSSSRISPGRS